MEIKQRCIISLDFNEFGDMNCGVTTLLFNGFSMDFNGLIDYDEFWKAYESREIFDFEKDYKALLDFMRNLMEGKNLKKRAREMGILKGSLVSFVNGGEIRDKTLSRLMSYYGYKIKVASPIGFEMSGEFTDVLEKLNRVVRDSIQGRSAYAISKEAKINYSMVNSWNNGISNLSLVNLAKLVPISIKF